MKVTITVEADDGKIESAASSEIPSIMEREIDLVREQRKWRGEPSTRAQTFLVALTFGADVLIDILTRARVKDTKAEARTWLFGKR